MKKRSAAIAALIAVGIGTGAYLLIRKTPTADTAANSAIKQLALRGDGTLLLAAGPWITGFRTEMVGEDGLLVLPRRADHA